MNTTTMKAYCLVLIFLFVSLGVRAQHDSGAVLTGKVTNEQNEVVEFATILLMNVHDSVNVEQTTATDTLGRFSLAGIKPGNYFIKIMALGYKHKASPPIAVVSGSPTFWVGVIALSKDSKALAEVIVEGERPIVERSMGKLTLNVANSFFKTATNALEVLRRAPGVQVNALGAITLSGAVTPVVYVDGKQLALTSEELKGLATTDIDQVEILANASGRYDGETRAVINIKLKRDKTLGIKGNAYVEGLSNRRYVGYSTGVSSTYKTKQGTYYGSVGFYDQNDFLISASKRTVREAMSNQVEFEGSTFVHYRSRPLSYLAVADYTLSKKHTVGVLVKGLVKTQRDLTDNLTSISNYNIAGSLYESYLVPSATLNNSSSDNVAMDVNYRGILSEKGDEIVAYADYASFHTLQNQEFRTAFPPNRNALRFPSSLLGQFPTTTSINSLRSDYVHICSPSLKLSAGGKISWTNTDNELLYDTVSATVGHVKDYSRSNRFLYKERTTAGYIGMTGERGKNSMEFIMRLEHTNAVGNSLTLENSVSRSYYRLLPSFQFYRKLNAQSTMSLTIARKVRRPTFYDLNPFRFYINPYEYNEGNPFLKAATILSSRLEATYKDVSVTVGYDMTSDQTAQLPIQDRVTNVIRYTRANLDHIQVVSLSASAPLAITKWWKMQSTLYLYHIATDSQFNGGDINNNAFSIYAYGQQIFTLPKSLTMELSYDYSGPSASQIYHSKSSGTINFSIQKALLKDRGTIQMQANDIFNTYREAFYGQYQDVDVNARQKRNVQQLSVRFTYQFGGSSFVRKGRASGSAEEEGRANR